MRCIIFGGFLGSGKTTVLKNLAQAIVKKYKDKTDTPIVIIENEIGEVSIDSRILGDYAVKELFAGCVCCTLSSDLTLAVKQINRDYAPEFIVIEATGLAHPDKIAATIKQYAKEVDDIRTAVLVDASRWYELMDYMDVFIANQVNSGDILLLNKADLAGCELTETIREELHEMNPDAKIYTLSAVTDSDAGMRDFIGGII